MNNLQDDRYDRISTALGWSTAIILLTTMVIGSIITIYKAVPLPE
jgi:hypothetical protein